jgi:hypothetical protein
MFVLDKKVIDAESMGASISSGLIPVGECASLSVHSEFTGSPVGTLTISASNNKDLTPVVIDTYAITAAGVAMRIIETSKYKYVKIDYTRTSGSGTLTCNVYGNET